MVSVASQGTRIVSEVWKRKHHSAIAVTDLAPAVRGDLPSRPANPLNLGPVTGDEMYAVDTRTPLLGCLEEYFKFHTY